MVGEIARHPATRGLPISGIGGIETWRDAAEFIAMGAGTVQVCTAAMHYGFKIVEDMIDGLGNWLDAKGHRDLDAVRGAAVPNYVEWKDLDMSFDVKARIDPVSCIGCGLCHVACEDTSHQAIRVEQDGGRRRFTVVDEDCVGCNLCAHVCPVEGCITMAEVSQGRPYVTWENHPRNPRRLAPAAE
jgi:dihydropyrimidine dehydrogenase (NAD+) subunit PreA